MMTLMERALYGPSRMIALTVVVGVLYSSVFASRVHEQSQQLSLLEREESILVKRIAETYQSLIQEFVPQQTMSWNVHASALVKDERTMVQREAARRIWQHSAPRQWQLLRQEQIKRRQLQVNQTLSSSSATTPTNDDDVIIWDDEDDIASYFEQLSQNCALKATNKKFGKNANPPFEVQCWDVLENLISAPRCTVRLDSRYPCRGTAMPLTPSRLREQQQHEAGEALLLRHFAASVTDNGTLNIVIIGAGPVGLLLANALTRLATDNEQPIRIVVFENRLDEDNNYGIPMKRAYTRNLITDLDFSFLYNLLDQAVQDFIQLVHNPEEFRVPLPINAIETLLLLSNKRRGVKFLYDNYRKYQHVLEQIPNLVAFDATGHRLDGPVEQVLSSSSTTSTTVRPWTWEETKMSKVEKQFFFERDYRHLVKTDSLVSIAQRELNRGPILFPVMSSDNAQPYVAHMLKINDIRMKSKDWDRLDHLQEKRPKSVSKYCKSKRYSPCRRDKDGNYLAADEDDEDGSEQQKTCYEWCGQISVYDQVGFYRSDIWDRMLQKRPANLGLTVLLASLTLEQADALWYLMRQDAGVLLLQDLPLDRLARMDVFQQNEMRRLLTFLSQTKFTGRADVSLFSLRPYLYSDPVVPGGLYGDSTIPLLRIGDSLASGDPNMGTGLGFHVQVLQKLINEIKPVLET